MQRTLRLTITAVGEPDSVFLTPCDPITLHESIGDEVEEGDHADDDDARDDDASMFTHDDFYVVIEPVEVPLPRSHRRAS